MLPGPSHRPRWGVACVCRPDGSIDASARGSGMCASLQKRPLCIVWCVKVGEREKRERKRKCV